MAGMCRLFGFRSVIQSQVHSSLMSSDNALATQSAQHPDGWGVAYYMGGSPHVVKSSQTAVHCQIFQRISGVVSSQTVLAHIRKATLGQKNILNTHPFQFGRWVFAHNGNIKDFDQCREKLIQLINPDLKRFLLGETDSELLFYILLSFINNDTPLHSENITIKNLIVSIKKALAEIQKIVGDYCIDPRGSDKETYLTFLLTNGTTMLAHQGGKLLYYSTYKNKCPDRDVCTSFADECEAPADKEGFVNHLLFSSEPLSGENVWIPMRPGDIIGVDTEMKLSILRAED
jgi:predicted glutamine amidotransferase